MLRILDEDKTQTHERLNKYKLKYGKMCLYDQQGDGRRDGPRSCVGIK